MAQQEEISNHSNKKCRDIITKIVPTNLSGAITKKYIMEYQEVISTIKGKSGVYDIITPHGKERRRLFLSQNNLICEFAPRSKKRGYPIDSTIIACWVSVALYTPNESNIVAKFKRYASRATFPSAFVRKCLVADTS